MEYKLHALNESKKVGFPYKPLELKLIITIKKNLFLGLIKQFLFVNQINTLIASCMKRTTINVPKSSPAILVNLLIIVQALNTARRKTKRVVQTQTLQGCVKKMKPVHKDFRLGNMGRWIHLYHPAQAKNNSCRRSAIPLVKLCK